MGKVRLYFQGMSEIVGSTEMGLIVLVDNPAMRQLTIVCDKPMEYQIGLRLSKAPITSKLLPEALWQMLQMTGSHRYELMINDVTDGIYRALLVNNDTLDVVSLRASDAVLLALFSGIPLYADDILMRNQSVPFTEKATGMAIPVNALSMDMLEKALEKAVSEENYELASHLRDELNRRKKTE